MTTPNASKRRLRFREGFACDAVLRQLEARVGGVRDNVRFPERENHDAPVELICSISGSLYAIEHTGIEPFDGFLWLQNEFERQIAPLREAVESALLLKDDLTLEIPNLALRGLKGKHWVKAREALTQWIVTTAPTLRVADVGRVALPVEAAQVAEVPFAVSLHRSRALQPDGGQFRVAHTVCSSTLEEQRVARLRRVCRDNASIPP